MKVARLCSAYALLSGTLFCLLSAPFAAAVEVPTLHPEASALPFSHQGPFVTTSTGAVLCVDSQQVHISADEGQTWTSRALFKEGENYRVSSERAILRTREGVILTAWMNLAERQQPKGWHWGESSVSWQDFILPTYTCRSADDGKTWEKPVRLSTPWCGCLHSMIQMKTGRIVLVGQEIIPQWRHATVMWVSDDLGQSWKRGDVLDYGIGAHDHAGSIEGAVVERADGSLYLLLRTESGSLWEAESQDGLHWTGLRASQIPSVTCCPQLTRLEDGRIALLWNAPPRHQPTNRSSRAELALAFSSDEARTWSAPIIVAANYSGGRVSYPYFYERHPGELWITTMQGNLRMKAHLDRLTKSEIPTFKPPTKPIPKPGGILFFGDSTTAPRENVEKVYAVRVEEALNSVGSTLTFSNAGLSGSTTTAALQRLEKEVLRHSPRLVVIQFGINDSAVDVWKSPPATEPRVPLPLFIKNYREIISRIQKKGSKVILMTTNPLRWTSKLRELYGKPPYLPEAETGMESPHLLAYNKAVMDLSEELKLPLVDVHSAYLPYAQKLQLPLDKLLPDGMHPSDEGHQLVTDLLVPVIRDTLRR